jgi:hypothetical protein
MPNDYVGRYGAALRSLTALEQPALPSAIRPDAPQPTGAGAFGAPPPGVMPPQQQAPGPAFAPPQVVDAPSQPAMAAPPPGPAMDKPISASQLYKDMPDDVKADLEKQIEDSGHNIDEVYAQKVSTGEIKAPKKEPTKRDKLGYIAEVALRTISNLSRKNTQGASDWADAVLETDARRGALAERDDALFRQGTAGAFERQEKTKETRRVEGRSDETARKERAVRVAETEGKQAFDMTESEKRRKHEKELAAIQEAGADRRDKDSQGNLITDEEGGLVRVKGDEATPVMTTKKVKETKRGKRGVSFTVEKEVREQVRALPKNVQSDIDPDRVISEIGDRIKALKEDRKLVSELRTQGITGAKLDDELAKRARDQVMSEYELAPGGRSAKPAQKGSNPFDQFDTR